MSAPGIESNSSNRLKIVPKTEADQQLLLLARLVFYVLADRTAIFAVTADGRVKGHVVPFGEDAIAERVTHLRRALSVDEVSRGIERKLGSVSLPNQGVTAIKLETLLQDLYAEIIAPVADVLPTDGTPVVIEPHCSLWLVPFAALQLPDGTWMGDRWSLIYGASASTLMRFAKNLATLHLLTQESWLSVILLCRWFPTMMGLKLNCNPCLELKQKLSQSSNSFPNSNARS
jgi:hypothetical protein